jgi:uncharacterized membrane protein YgcG
MQLCCIVVEIILSSSCHIRPLYWSYKNNNKGDNHMINVIRNTINKFRTSNVYTYSHFRQPLAGLPPELFAYWQRTASIEFEGIPRDAFFFARAAEGLMMFFDCVRSSGKPCGLPSKAADSVWHAWSQIDPEHLQRFCITYFGRDIPHTEGPDMAIAMDQALANTLVTAREQEGLPTAGMNVPRLFSLDRRLGMPEGYAYSVVRGLVAWRHMNRRGKGEGTLYYPACLAAPQLLAAGLVTQAAYEDYERRAKENGGSCGSGCGSSASDGGGSDGGGCGSSCGGGCGGGCG